MDTTRLCASGRIYCENIPAVVLCTEIPEIRLLSIDNYCELMRWIHFECQDLIVPVMDMLYLVPVTVVVCAKRDNQLGAMVGQSEILQATNHNCPPGIIAFRHIRSLSCNRVIV